MTIQKQITQKEVRALFSYNPKTGILRWKVARTNRIKVGSIAGSKNSNGYILINIKGKKYKAHQIIWLGKYGYIPEQIDHKDRVRHHNWLSNLRETTNQYNQRNTNIRKDNKSGVKGVSFVKRDNVWRSSITINKRKHNLGYYKNFDNAVCARLAAEQCLNWDRFDSNSSAYQYVKDNIINMGPINV